ncbi:MAG: histidine kinase dimerization/phosphoacceptor domain -containing protein [Beijerinckiaceae bacterium]|nr:histidine kinase dimerization/phosphoacceptor domain -containing protein [Beijerinckiaceae bacterium]
MTFVTPVAVEAASTLAVIAASREPLLFLDEHLKVIAASGSFCRDFQIEPASIPGRALSGLGSGEWGPPQLSSLLKATASGNALVDAYEMNLIRKDQPTRCVLLSATKLDDGDKGRIRLLLAITDVTMARAESREKDDLIREKGILLQEVQHRVANSLQIIASLLMQSARMVQSVEARGHLQNAHHRVMSIAAVQRHLSLVRVGDVPLRPYLTQLCESLGASMIHDQKRLSIVTTVDNSSTNATASVSLGLIVTELVINALKHGFPDHRAGTIYVDYSAVGPQWALTVKDDGVGMPVEHLKPGLGTGIVEALAGQLDATVTTTDARPGTSVTVIRNGASGAHPSS